MLTFSGITHDKAKFAASFAADVSPEKAGEFAGALGRRTRRPAVARIVARDLTTVAGRGSGEC
jgi:hypothetical protein